ncbi:hypothetical protein DAMA08_017110 [Martiniozyma asiatica (nom. inval.)]|nr:hypothetical protein DAMA08_017110 [Martiniozyma asiatica]
MVVTRSRTGHLPKYNPVLDDNSGDEEDDDFAHKKSGKKRKIKYKGKANQVEFASPNGSNLLSSDKDNFTESKKVDNGDHGYSKKIKKIPNYKVEQIKKVQKLVKMSNIAKPRGMWGEYGAGANKSLSEDEIKLTLKMKLANSRDKISSLTNYDPMRNLILKKSTSKKPSVTKINNYINNIDNRKKRMKIPVPDLSKDRLLKQALIDLKQSRFKLKNWNSPDIDASMFNKNDKYAVNDLGVNILSLTSNEVCLLKKNQEWNKWPLKTSKLDAISDEEKIKKWINESPSKPREGIKGLPDIDHEWEQFISSGDINVKKRDSSPSRPVPYNSNTELVTDIEYPNIGLNTEVKTNDAENEEGVSVEPQMNETEKPELDLEKLEPNAEIKQKVVQPEKKSGIDCANEDNVDDEEDIGEATDGFKMLDVASLTRQTELAFLRMAGKEKKMGAFTKEDIFKGLKEKDWKELREWDDGFL